LRVTKSDLAELLPTSVQKSYFMLSRSTRAVLDTALRKYRPGRTDLIPVGDVDQLKPALRLMTSYRLTIRDVVGNEVLTSYTRWLEFVQVKEGPGPEDYVAFSPRFERIWLESRKRLPEYMEQKPPANSRLRSQYSLRLYSWAKKYVEEGSQTIALEELRRVFGLESIKDSDGNIIKEAPLPVWANFQQRALDVAILEINTKTDLKIKLASTERSKHRRVVALGFPHDIVHLQHSQRHGVRRHG
jgi:plasmid replication initiation protein